MIETIKELVRRKDTCVLATVSAGKPYCSLMAYIADPECREIYLVTHRQTKKYQNLLESPWVSILIDTREEDPGSKIAQKKALTISGLFQKIEPHQKEEVRAQFLERHPQLKGFAEDPDAEFFCIRVHSFPLMQGVRDAYFALPK